MPGKAFIGTSGWNYKSWRDGFYGDTPQKQWLRFCAERFTGIEVNGSFYKLPEKSTFKKWRDVTPEDFCFAIKGHRYVTHNKKLIDVEEPVIRCRDAASSLGSRLAAVLWQLPASVKKDMKRLKRFVKILGRWKSTRHTIEFRHKSWFDNEVIKCMSDHAIAVCMSDAPDWPMWDRVTTDLVYILARPHPQIRLQLHQARAQKVGDEYPQLAQREPGCARLFRQRCGRRRPAKRAYTAGNVASMSCFIASPSCDVLTT
jgi:uncharacterized protein YecE (DUF72 family)